MRDFEFQKLNDPPRGEVRISTTYQIPGTDFTVVVSSPEGQILLMLYQEIVEIRKLLQSGQGKELPQK